MAAGRFTERTCGRLPRGESLSRPSWSECWEGRLWKGMSCAMSGLGRERPARPGWGAVGLSSGLVTVRAGRRVLFGCSGKERCGFLFSLLLLFTFGVEHELGASPMLRACSAVSGTLATEEGLLMDTGPELQTCHRHGKSSWGQCCHPLESLYRKCPPYGSLSGCRLISLMSRLSLLAPPPLGSS